MRLLGLLLALVSGGAAYGATADGTLITNVACATAGNASGVPYTVTYCATTVVVVRNPAVMLVKTANPTTQSSGGTVTFTLWVVGIECQASAFNVTVVDRLPDNVMYTDNLTSWGGASAGVWTPFASSDNVTYVAGQPLNGQVTPYYLRWNLTLLGPCKSAFVQFTAAVL